MTDLAGQPASEAEVVVAARSDRASLGWDTMWAGGHELARIVSALVVFVILARELGPAGYGEFVGLQALVAILAVVSSSAVVLYLIQEVVREERPMGEVLPMALGLSCASAPVVIAAAMVAGTVLLPDTSTLSVFGMAVSEAIGVAAMAIAAGVQQASVSYRAAARTRAGYQLIRTAAIGVLWLVGTITLGSVVAMIVVVSLVAGGASLLAVSRRLHVPLTITRPRLQEARRTLSYSVTGAAFAVNEDADKTLMVRLGTPIDAGVYAAAYRILAPVLAPVRALLAASHTRFLLDDEGQDGVHARRATRYTLVSGAYGLAATVALAVVAGPLVDALGGGFEETATVLRWLAPLILLRSLGLFAFNALLGLRDNGIRTLIVVAVAATNVVANLVLIPRYSWRGAAATSIGCEVLFLALTWGAVLTHQLRLDRRRA